MGCSNLQRSRRSRCGCGLYLEPAEAKNWCYFFRAEIFHHNLRSQQTARRKSHPRTSNRDGIQCNHRNTTDLEGPRGRLQEPHFGAAPMKADPTRLEIFKNLFHSVAAEMGAALRPAAFSPTIKARRD